MTEAAKELGFTRAAVHRAIKQGRLEANRGEIVRVAQPEPRAGRSPAKASTPTAFLCSISGSEKNSLTVDGYHQPSL